MSEAALIEVMLSSPLNDLRGSEPEARARARAKPRALLHALARDGLVPKSALAEREHPGNAVLPDLGCGFIRDRVQREIRANGEPEPTYRAYLTIDPARQLAAVAALADADDALRRGGAGEAAFVGLDRTGGVEAFVGGTDYVASQFDRAGRARRSPGSVGKVLVLAEACERGYDLDSMVEDVPQPGGRPADDDGRYLGTIALVRALAADRASPQRRAGVNR